MAGQTNTNNNNDKERFFLNEESDINIEGGKIIFSNIKRNGSKQIYTYTVTLEDIPPALLAKLRTELMELRRKNSTIL